MEPLKRYRFLLIILFVAIGGAIFYNYVLKEESGDMFNVTGQKLPTLSRASLEKLPDGFYATWLILGHTAVVTSGQKLPPDPKFLVQYEVQFESHDNYSFLRDQYLTYFAKSGWTLDQQIKYGSFSAQRSFERAQVVFAPQGTDGLLVTVRYGITPPIPTGTPEQ